MPESPEPRSSAGAVTTALGRWAYAVHGAPRRAGAPDVLLLHGAFVDSGMWREQVGPLARLARVVTLDLPGHGGSQVAPPFTLEQNADALAGALEDLGVRRAVCVGWSWGGALALHLALRDPGRVAALVPIAATAGPPDAYRRAKYRLLVAFVRRLGLPPWLVRAQIAPLLFARATRRERRDVVDAFVRSATAVPREALVRAVLAVGIDPANVLGRLAGVRVPTLVLSGAEERAYPPDAARRLAAAIPGATLARVPGAGHCCVLERPDEVNRLLVPFVAAQVA
jgi:pimeloyl-ACP methyl ester carboxylesterase